MKNRGVLITIILILVLGAGITFRMHQFVTENTSFAASPEAETTEDAAAEDAGEAGSSLEIAVTAQLAAAMGHQSDTPETEEAPDEMPAPDSVTKEAANEAYDEAEAGPMTEETESPEERMAEKSAPVSLNEKSGDMAEADSEEETVMSPLAAAPAGSASEEVMTAADYQKKLEDVDRIVKELRDADTTANTTDSVRNIAEYEYRLWDTELNRIYQAVISSMSENEAEQLRGEERQWIRSRDQMAKQAAAKLKGGTMESLEYTASLSVSTRARAYELLEDYGDLLSHKEQED